MSQFKQILKFKYFQSNNINNIAKKIRKKIKKKIIGSKQINNKLNKLKLV